MILGSPGSGKTVLSKKLGQALRINVYHLDKLLWNPQWVEKPFDEMEYIHSSIICREEWIVDGYYHKLAKKRFELSDTIIILDLPRWKCLFRVIKRMMVKSREDLANGCSNKIDINFLKYVWNYKNYQLVEIKNCVSQYSDKDIVIFRKTHQVNRYIKELQDGYKST